MRRGLTTLALLLGLIGVSRPAAAFCGFYVEGSGTQLVADATQVVLMRAGTRTVLSMQNHYAGPPEAFAIVVPVPVVLHAGDVKTLPRDVLARVDALDAPRLVEYWERDPCAPVLPDHGKPDRAAAAREESRDAGVGAAVKVEAQFVVAEYQIVILSATDSTALDRWLKDQRYAIPAGAEPLLRPYVEGGWKFFVAKVDPKKVAFDEHGGAQLSPLRVRYDSEDFVLPVRLGLINSPGTQDLIVHILARDTRYEVASHPNVFIPTNLDVTPSVQMRFAEMYAGLFDRTLELHPRAVVTEYAWAASSCDPCPGPSLGAADLATLGGDVVGGAGGFVLTRLHARYGKELQEDLVFRAAPPVSGGREQPDAAGVLPTEPTASTSNSFQARYALRHAWDGPIQCAEPHRGIWGGPPVGETYAGPTAGTDLGFAPRGKVALDTLVAGGMPGVPSPAAPPIAAVEAPPLKEPRTGCGCQGSQTPSSALALLALLLVIRRRTRRMKP